MSDKIKRKQFDLSILKSDVLPPIFVNTPNCDGTLSDCCGAEIIYSDICTACGEHCEAFEVEE